MQLIYCTWKDIEKYLDSSNGVIIPIGATEQHGPTGYIGTDAICAETIACGVGEATDALVGPTINIGMSVHHTTFPGTITFKPSTLIQVVSEYVFSLARHGFERFFFLNGHGGNMNTLDAAFWDMYSRIPELNLSKKIRFQTASWYLMPNVNSKRREIFGDKEGGHATPSEVSLAIYAHPEHEHKVDSLPSFENKRMTKYGPEDFRRSRPDGRTGSDPSVATAEHGKYFYELAVQEISESYKNFMNEE